MFCLPFIESGSKILDDVERIFETNRQANEAIGNAGGFALFNWYVGVSH
jgi:hypothetical protein